MRPEHELVEAQRLPRDDLRELGAQRAGDRVGQPVVAGHRRDVQRDDPAGREPLSGTSRKNCCVAR